MISRWFNPLLAVAQVLGCTTLYCVFRYIGIGLFRIQQYTLLLVVRQLEIVMETCGWFVRAVWLRVWCVVCVCCHPIYFTIDAAGLHLSIYIFMCVGASAGVPQRDSLRHPLLEQIFLARDLFGAEPVNRRT